MGFAILMLMLPPRSSQPQSPSAAGCPTKLRSEYRGRRSGIDAQQHKELVRRLVDEVVNKRNPAALDEVASGTFARIARRWISPFRQFFPDFRMEIVDLIAEDDRIVAHFKCSGTHEGEWLGYPRTGRRFESVDEIYIFRVKDGKLVSATAVEDNLSRLRQLDLYPAKDRG